PSPVRHPTPRALARAASRAVATDATHVYFGDDDDDALLVIAKDGGETVNLARRAPVRRALARDGDLVAWVGTPGDALLRMALQGGVPTTLRDRGIFADVAVDAGDVFVTEVVAQGGVVTRITGATAARLGAFEGLPRGIAVDEADVFVATTSAI